MAMYWNATPPGFLFIERQDALPPNLVKSLSYEIVALDYIIAVKFGRHLRSSAAQANIKPYVTRSRGETIGR